MTLKKRLSLSSTILHGRARVVPLAADFTVLEI
jgi:hypothetical protein